MNLEISRYLKYDGRLNQEKETEQIWIYFRNKLREAVTK